MDIHNQSRLSYYKWIADLGEKENVSLVQHIDTKQIYVMKKIDVYDRHVYEVLMSEQPPMIPKIYECIESDGILYLIEQYIFGITVEDYIRRYGCFNIEQVRRITELLCEILDYLHNLPNAIIHRDIKPSNIILCGDFEQDKNITEIYLIDYNTAREYNAAVKQDTVLMGTIGFAAPEQYGFGQSDVRTDIYSLGALINYMLCGKMLSEAVYTKDNVFSKIIQKSTMIAPEQRYQNVNEIRAELGTTENSSKIKDFRSFLPPGFRSGKPFHVIIAAIYYLFVTWLSFTLEIEGTNGSARGIVLWFNRLMVFLWSITCALIWGNYRDIWNHLPFMKNRILRILGFVIYPIVLFFVFVIITVLFEDVCQ